MVIMGVSIGMWGPPKLAGWVFVNGKSPSFEMDDDWGYPYDETETNHD